MAPQPPIPLSRPDITQREIDAVVDVLHTDTLSIGPKVVEFENLCATLTGVPVQYTAGRGFGGAQFGSAPVAPGADHFGEVQAWNVDTGQKVWTHNYPRSPNWGSMLATGGGLVFSGGTADRKFAPA